MESEAPQSPLPDHSKDAREALEALVRLVQDEHDGQLRIQAERGASEESAVTLPQPVVDVLIKVLGHMAEGDAVQVLPVHAEVTTHQAAALLNVSRPYFIRLLDAGHMPFRMVGTHRRIRLSDLMHYKQEDDARRDEALTELTQQAEDLGLGYGY